VTPRRAPARAWFTSGQLATLALDAALAEALPLLRAAGVEPLLIKGPAVAHWLYDDPRERAYADVDLLVSRADVDRARCVFAGLGYADLMADKRASERTGHAATFERGHATIDLHWRLMLLPEGDAYALLSRGGQTIRVAGADVRVPPASALALIVALHAAQHGHAHTPAAADLTRAVESVDHATWQAAAGLAHEAGATVAFAAGLRVVAGGEALATQLGLPAEIPIELRLQARAAYGMQRLIALRNATGWRRRGVVLISTLFPSPAFMRAYDPRAQHGRSGLLTAYAARIPRLVIRTLSTIRDYIAISRDQA
jgi:hypothetical protein